MIISHIIYTISWIIACLCAVFIYLSHPKDFLFTHRQYWVFLLKPWKVITFFIGTTFMVLIAPYPGDFTWDYFDALFMAVLTYVTAPWVVGIFYKFKLHKVSAKQAYIALCVWLFSASWSYDIYLLWRDKHYPATWSANMVLSSILYWCGGLLWSLDWQAIKACSFRLPPRSGLKYPAAMFLEKLSKRDLCIF